MWVVKYLFFCPHSRTALTIIELQVLLQTLLQQQGQFISHMVTSVCLVILLVRATLPAMKTPSWLLFLFVFTLALLLLLLYGEDLLYHWGNVSGYPEHYGCCSWRRDTRFRSCNICLHMCARVYLTRTFPAPTEESVRRSCAASRAKVDTFTKGSRSVRVYIDAWVHEWPF